MARITVVDDSRVDRMLIAGLLRANDVYEISFAENGKDALERIEGFPPDLVAQESHPSDGGFLAVALMEMED